jgi:hypothetical protein
MNNIRNGLMWEIVRLIRKSVIEKDKSSFTTAIELFINNDITFDLRAEIQLEEVKAVASRKCMSHISSAITKMIEASKEEIAA